MIDPRLEDLADACLQRIAHVGEAAIPAFCKEHDLREDELRRILANLGRVGLLQAVSGEVVPRQLGDFVLLRRIGEGGMAVVYEAQQQSLGRTVALKLMRTGAFFGSHMRERFRREVSALGRLDHPGICAVYDAGEVDGIPYLAMRLVDGETLAARIARDWAAAPAKQSDSRTAAALTATLELIEKAARAVHAAHEAGVIHRDLKPANIMVDTRGEPVVLDFGLARASDGETFTATGDQLGTPAYMAPEQIEPSRGPTDRRTDVYGLGATLYECVTLRPAFAVGSREATFHAILHAEVEDPRRWNRRVGRELGIVLRKALDKDPHRRFATAAEFADELRAIRCHLPIKSRRPSLPLRCWRWAQRNRAAATALVLTSVGLLVSLLLLRSNAEVRLRLQAQVYASAAGEVLSENPMLAFKLARAALRMQPSDWDHAMRLQQATWELHEHACLDDFGGQRLRRVLWSPDAELLLVALDGVGPPHLYDRRGHPIARLDVQSIWEALAFDPGSAEIAAGGEGTVRFFDRRGALLRTCSFGTAQVRVVRYSPDGQQLVVGSSDGTAAILRRDGTLRAPLVGHFGPLQSAAWMENTHVVTGGGSGVNRVADPAQRDYTVRIWSLDGELLHTMPGHEHTVWDLACSGDRIATASFDGTLRLWDVRGNALVSHELGPEQVLGIEFSPDGGLLASCSNTGRIRLHDRDGRLVCSWHAQKTVSRVRFLADGHHVVTAGWNQLLQIWTQEGKELHAWRGHLNGLTDVACSPDGQLFASTSWDGTARIWSEGPRGHRIIAGLAGGVLSLAVAPDGSRVLATGRQGETVLTDADGGVLFRRNLNDSRPVAAGFDCNGRRLLIAYADGTLFHGDRDATSLAQIDTGLELCGAVFLPDGDGFVLAAGTRIYGFSKSSASAAPVAWPRTEETLLYRLLPSPDGRRLIVVTMGGGVELWDPLQRTLLAGIKVDKDSYVQSVALSRDGRSLLLALESGVAELWDVREGTRLRTYYGHQGGVLDAAFSPDVEQRYVVTASNDDTIRCFDRVTGAQVAVLRGHSAGVAQVAFSADGRNVISGSFDGTVRWWWLHPEDVLRAAEGLGIGDPTAAERQLVPFLFR